MKQIKICLDQINFGFKSSKLHLLPNTYALICLFLIKIYLMWTNIYLSQRYFVWTKQILFNSNKFVVWIKKSFKRIFSFHSIKFFFWVYRHKNALWCPVVSPKKCVYMKLNLKGWRSKRTNPHLKIISGKRRNICIL